MKTLKASKKAPAKFSFETTLDYSKDGLVSEVILVERGTYNRYKIGGVPKGCEGRKEYQGPMVAGPWHFIFGLCTVIDNHGGTGAEMTKARAERRVFEVSDGDAISIDGLRYTVHKTFNGVLKLV